jgi:four helix bundle protein
MQIQDYKDLRIWQNGIEIVDNIYSTTESFPKNEVYGLTSQMRRAAISILSNIAEGFVRKHTKEYLHFLSISLGSCAELDTQFVISKNRDYVTENIYHESIKQINHEMRMISSLMNKL